MIRHTVSEGKKDTSIDSSQSIQKWHISELSDLVPTWTVSAVMEHKLLHLHTLLTSFVRWQMSRLVSNFVPVNLRH